MIDGCPYAELTPDVLELLDLAEYARKGALPVAGGVLDQPEVAMQAIEFIREEQARWLQSEVGHGD